MTDGVLARRDGHFFLLGRHGLALSLFGWSVPFWLFFELLNFRLANWYYVFVPNGAAARWVGIAISFATVLPAIFLAERALRVYGPWREISAIDGLRAPAGPGTRSRIGPRTLAGLQATGLLCLILPLVWPHFFFPLVWVAPTLIADPWVYRRDPERSLLHDLESRRLRRPVRLLVGGMAIGLLWELFNASARGKWIYTVPGLEDLKLFEMPVLGFFGFPFLALEGWSAYQALVVAGLAADPRSSGDHPARDRRPDRRPGWVLAAAGLAALFSFLVLRGMEAGTISSTTPRLEAFADPTARALGGWGYDVFDIADADPAELAAATPISADRAADWIEWARLVTLRGIGVDNAARLRALGVTSLEELAAASPDELTVRLAETGRPVRPARVRVWVRAAREAVKGEAAGGARLR